MATVRWTGPICMWREGSRPTAPQFSGPPIFSSTPRSSFAMSKTSRFRANTCSPPRKWSAEFSFSDALAEFYFSATPGHLSEIDCDTHFNNLYQTF